MFIGRLWSNWWGNCKLEVGVEKSKIFLFIQWVGFLANSTESGFNETAIRKVFGMLYVMIRHNNFDETDEVHEFKRALNQFNLSIENLMLNLMQPCNRMIIHCVWLNKAIPCDELFQVSKTSKGFCCSFNYEDIQS